ncbi:MAG: hypothetical protein ABSB14_19180 [Candidatus Sulfotelmatobacter sp.]|jgi:hypothetical protein
MTATTHELTFNGGLLERGFWLYVWEITTPQDTHLYYVGRTGDSSSIKAQSPFNRMGQHLGFNNHGNPLRRYLKTEDVDPERCFFRLVAYGPILEEAATQEEHRQRRDRIGAMEKALAEAMASAGYRVINTVHCRIKVDAELFARIRDSFASNFEKLAGAA